MLDALVKSIENTFVQFSPRRLLYLTFLIVVVLGGLLLFDRATEYSFLHRIDGRITALERLRTLEREGIDSSRSLRAPYQELVARIQTPPSSEQVIQIGTIGAPVTKFLAASAIPLIFCLVALVQMAARVPRSGSAFGGAFVVTILLGVPAAFIPTIVSLPLTAGVLLAIQLIAMVSMVRYYTAKRRAAAT